MSAGHLPTLALRLDGGSRERRRNHICGPYIQSLENLEELNSVVIAATQPPGLKTWQSLQQARQDVAADGFAFSIPWWEMESSKKDGSEPFVTNCPLLRSQVEFEATAPLVGLALTRSMYKWPRVLYVDPTDRPNDDVHPFAGSFLPFLHQYPEQARTFRQGDFSVATPIPLLIDFHTRPLRYFNPSWSLQTATGERRDEPENWAGAVQTGRELRADTPPGPQQDKIAYMVLIGITASINEQVFRLCGSMLFDDATDTPYRESEAIQVLMKTCPYFDIGTTLSCGPGAEAVMRACDRFESTKRSREED